MSLFVSIIQAFPPTLWEKHGLAPHTLTLLQVSKEMVEAVCYVGRAALPAHVYAQPSQIREVLYWNRLMYSRLDLTRVKLTVQFMPETDTAAYIATARNVIDGFRYMPNVVKLDMSELTVIGDEDFEIFEVDWFTGEMGNIYWEEKDTKDFLDELVQNCVLLEDLQLGILMRDVVAFSWGEQYVNGLSNLHTLSVLTMDIDCEVGMNVMNLTEQFTSLTELNMDRNSIGNLQYILPGSFNLVSLGLAYCDLGADVLEQQITESNDGVTQVLTEYPSLVHLDLGGNQYGDEQGEAIANALRSNTSLMTLNLRENRIGPAVREQIANAWKHWKHRKTANLFLDEWSYEPDMEDE